MAKRKPNVTKADIVNEISRMTGLGKNETLAVVEAYHQIVIESLTKKKSVQIRKFGSYIIKKKAPKKARNITLGTTIDIPGHDSPGFKPSKSFIKKVKEA